MFGLWELWQSYWTSKRLYPVRVVFNVIYDHCLSQSFHSNSAQDSECGATTVDVEAYEVEVGKMGITVQDNGIGMTQTNLHCMLSFGFSSKEHVQGNVGRFGIGFKSGSMRLADDALILTRQVGQASAALLSTTFLRDIDADDILIPMFTWKIETVNGQESYISHEPVDTAVWEQNMGIVERYTFLKSEFDLLAEFSKIKSPTGTRIILFNLKQPLEFDFEGDPHDIRMRGHEKEIDEMTRTSSRKPIFQQYRAGQQMTLDVPEDYSLRAYMEILYLRPAVAFTLRGERILPRCPIQRLEVEYYQFEPYSPKGITDARATPIVIHIGYQNPPGKTKHCGFHIYNKNRLIRMYQRFGAQLQVNTMMKDLLGVVEADCLEPTHNKQAFNTTEILYAKCQKYIEKCMNEYYFGMQSVRLAGIGSGKKRAPSGKRKLQVGTKKITTCKTKELKKDAAFDDSTVTDQHDQKSKRNKDLCRISAKDRSSYDTFPKILRKLMTNRLSWPFNEPVDAEYWGVSDYYDVIKTPMDFGTISTKYDRGDYRTENSGHGPLQFVTDIRQVFYNAWTYNQPGHQVYRSAQELAKIFESDLSRTLGDDDKWGLISGTTIAMTSMANVLSENGNTDFGLEENTAGEKSMITFEDITGKEDDQSRDGVTASCQVHQETIKMMVETRAAQAISKAVAMRDEALARLQEERVARETFEAELEAQTMVNIRIARQEEQARYFKLEIERETLLTCLADSNNVKKLLQDKIGTLESEVNTLKANIQSQQIPSRYEAT